MLFIYLLIILIAGSFLSIYSYGRFAKQAKGEPSYTLPIQDNQTKLDRSLSSAFKQHANQSSLMLITDNLDAFAIRATCAREAGRSLDLQYYMWHDDLTGHLLGYEIIAAAERGVRVRLLIDDMNAHGHDSLFAALTMHPNIEIRLFNPTRTRGNVLIRGLEMLLRLVSINHRMHNKAWIADGRVAIVGGRNIGDEYFNAATIRNFFDVDLLIGGAAVQEASQIFDQFWNSNAVIPLSSLTKPHQQQYQQRLNTIKKNQENPASQPYIQKLKQAPSVKTIFKGEWKIYWTDHVHIYSDPVEKVFDQQYHAWLKQKIQSLIKRTENNLQIISPYFVPGHTGINELLTLRKKPVDISILTNSLAATDVLLVHSGYIPCRKKLLKAGIELYELKPFGAPDHSLIGSSGASLHTKAFLIDNRIGFIGSFNFDPRSALLNTEMGVLFMEPAIVRALQQEFSQRTSSQYSYKVFLQQGTLCWQDSHHQQSQRIWRHEPQSRWWQRWIVKIASYLPIKSQL
jgi:cardiolipin synthase C